ncbi:hypothetical protein HPB47_028116 [Ixodes persulcatus]|uniref:Uncharacterized protein n=1 Tax=Ixodes persulcatus TaxID=34615 RepID=A0AC60PVV1_IXOPE|nr:hypothetical protein HPB47_028116 [Ixodes persulcatus]
MLRSRDSKQVAYQKLSWSISYRRSLEQEWSKVRSKASSSAATFPRRRARVKGTARREVLVLARIAPSSQLSRRRVLVRIYPAALFSIEGGGGTEGPFPYSGFSRRLQCGALCALSLGVGPAQRSSSKALVAVSGCGIGGDSRPFRGRMWGSPAVAAWGPEGPTR